MIIGILVVAGIGTTYFVFLAENEESDEDLNNDPDGPTKALSGSIERRSDGWLVEINAGSVDWNADNIQLYNTDTDQAETYDESANFSDPANGQLAFTDIDGQQINVTWNDNDASGDINGGDIFRLTADNPDDISNWEFRIANTNLQLQLE